jgi:hypothetical protein
MVERRRTGNRRRSRAGGFFFVLVRGCGGENNEFSRCLLGDGEEAAGDFCLMMQPDFLI